LKNFAVPPLRSESTVFHSLSATEHDDGHEQQTRERHSIEKQVALIFPQCWQIVIWGGIRNKVAVS
jgi:hypothetical protein